ncbi:MAG: histidine-type phosphatase [Acidobacteriaceae bacterium]
MLRFPIARPLPALASSFALACGSLAAQIAPPAPAQLKLVVVLTRHGVRSPTGDPARYAKYSRAAWPQWDVPPGYLTPHGFEDMKLFGAWDRSLLARQGLLSAAGCADSARVWFYADSDQRTRESGRALAEGLFPECPPPVHGLPQGTPDDLFHPGHRAAAMLRDDPPANPVPEPPGEALLRQAEAERLTRQYHSQIAQMDRILATCGPPLSPDHPRVSLFDVPTAPPPGTHGHSDDLRGPMGAAAGLSENFLLEYAQGMPMRDVGWGCISRITLNSLIAIHNAASDYEQRVPWVARRDASGLLDRIRAAMQQAVTGQALVGAPDPPGERVLFFVGHDTNLTTVAALLHLTWTAGGRHDDTPPGSALVFELWRSRASGDYFVSVYFTAQTLDQLRNATPLTPAHPPLRVPLTIGGCSRAGAAGCSWTAFSQLSGRAIDPDYVHPVQDTDSARSRAAFPQSRPR